MFTHHSYQRASSGGPNSEEQYPFMPQYLASAGYLPQASCTPPMLPPTVTPHASAAAERRSPGVQRTAKRTRGASKSTSPVGRRGNNHNRTYEPGRGLEVLEDGGPNVKPAHCAADLILHAIQGSPTQSMRAEDIRSAIKHRFVYYRVPGREEELKTLSGTIRHHLSNYPCFQRAPKDPRNPGKGDVWTINPSMINGTPPKKKPADARRASSSKSSSRTKETHAEVVQSSPPPPTGAIVTEPRTQHQLPNAAGVPSLTSFPTGFQHSPPTSYPPSSYDGYSSTTQYAFAQLAGRSLSAGSPSSTQSTNLGSPQASFHGLNPGYTNSLFMSPQAEPDSLENADTLFSSPYNNILYEQGIEEGYSPDQLFNYYAPSYGTQSFM